MAPLLGAAMENGGCKATSLAVGGHISLACAGMYRMLRLAGLDPGAEFKAAITEAQALGARYDA